MGARRLILRAAPRRHTLVATDESEDEMSEQRGLSLARQLSGFALALAGGLLLLVPLRSLHGAETTALEVLSYQLLVVAVALLGGIWPALFAALFSGVVIDLTFIVPYREITIADPIHVLVLLLHIAIAVLVSIVVGRNARTRRRLAVTVDEFETVTDSDRLRGALLSALSHDLRRPLAAASASVGGLRAAGSELSEEDRRTLLETADESLAALGALVTDLLDASRLQAGVISVAEIATDPAEAILPALDELQLGSSDVELALDHGDAELICDPVLLQRTLVNLLANAVRHSPAGAAVRVETAVTGDRLEIRVVDHGPGIPEHRRDEVFMPFQRLGDTDNTTGLGLGLALARGFVEAMRGELRPEQTPGTGLTMVVSLPAATPPSRERVTP